MQGEKQTLLVTMIIALAGFTSVELSSEGGVRLTSRVFSIEGLVGVDMLRVRLFLVRVVHGSVGRVVIMVRVSCSIDRVDRFTTLVWYHGLSWLVWIRVVSSALTCDLSRCRGRSFCTSMLTVLFMCPWR